jgi:hypothetical protein
MKASIPAILRALGGALVSVPDVFGPKAAKLSPILNTLGALAEVPAALEPEREALLEQIQRWVDEKREPTDAELDAFKDQRDELDQKLRDARAALGGP